jgi:hypothetical protein
MIYLIILVLLCLAYCMLCWVEAVYDGYHSDDD